MEFAQFLVSADQVGAQALDAAGFVGALQARFDKIGRDWVGEALRLDRALDKCEGSACVLLGSCADQDLTRCGLLP